MSLKDKLEIGLKPDAPYRPDNLPDFQKDDPACEVGAQPGETPRLRRARDVCDDAGQPVSRNTRGVAPPKQGRMAKAKAATSATHPRATARIARARRKR